MSYVKINGDDTKYNVSLESFETQHGNKAVRFVGDEIPATDNGFKYYGDDDTELYDLSAYKYEYRQNEYTIELDSIDLPIGTDEPIPTSAIDRLNNKVNALSNRVSSITPYEDTKIGYFGEKEKVFYGVPQGNTSVFFDNYIGEYSTERIADRLTVEFPERLSDMTSITIMVQ